MAHTEKEILDYWMKKDSLGLNWTQEDRIIFAMREFANQSAQQHPTISKTEKVQTAVGQLIKMIDFEISMLKMDASNFVEWSMSVMFSTLIKIKTKAEQSKQTEREQMHKCASFWRGKECEIEKPIFEKYYTKTYGK